MSMPWKFSDETWEGSFQSRDRCRRKKGVKSQELSVGQFKEVLLVDFGCLYMTKKKVSHGSSRSMKHEMCHS
jgi:hypothetical protein